MMSTTTTAAELNYIRSGDIDRLLEDVLLAPNYQLDGNYTKQCQQEEKEPLYARVCRKKPPGTASKFVSSRQLLTPAVERRVTTAADSADVLSKRCQSHEVLESVSCFKVHPAPASVLPGRRTMASSDEGGPTSASGVALKRVESSRVIASPRDHFAVRSNETVGQSGKDACANGHWDYTEITALKPIGKGVQTLRSHKIWLAANKQAGRGAIVVGDEGPGGCKRSLHQSEPALQQTQGAAMLDQKRCHGVGNLRAATFQASSCFSSGHQQRRTQAEILEAAIAQVVTADDFETSATLSEHPSYGGSAKAMLTVARATCRLWYRPRLCREAASDILARQPPGSFIIRASSSHPGCYDLALRVQQEQSNNEAASVRHLLLERCGQGGQNFRVAGGSASSHGSESAEFASLSSLVAEGAVGAIRHPSIPRRLRLPTAPGHLRGRRQQQRPECVALHLAGVDVEAATGAAAVARATEALMRNRHRLKARVCRLRAAPNGGVWVVDGDGDEGEDQVDGNGEGVGMYMPAECVLHCGYDPGLRSYDSNEARTVGLPRPRIFGFVLRKQPDRAEHTAILFCDHCDQQRAEALVQFVRHCLGL